MKGEKIITEEVSEWLVVRLMLMVKTKDPLIFMIDDFYIGMLLHRKLIYFDQSYFGMKITQKGKHELSKIH